MDLIVAACRALACRPRLHLLRALQARPASTVNGLAETVGLAPGLTSHQLKLLSNFHFVQAVPCGRYVRYQPAKTGNVSNAFLRETLELLHRTMGELNSTPHEVWNSGAQKEKDEELMKLFTTYTHLRRLLMLRQLAAKGACSAADLAVQVGMSAAATSRHLLKLQRRGVVRAEAPPPHMWHLVRSAAPALRRNMLDIVLRALKTT
jgi:DNA-binding transcriptional ArsR family regulator